MSDDEDLDLEYEFIHKKAFQIGDLPKTVDLSVAPKTGLEYLYQVKYESQLYPEVVTANIDTTKFRHKQTINVNSHNECQPAPPGYAPSAEWQTQQVIDFSDLRQKLSYQKANFKGKATVVIPNVSDMHAWYVFCFGKVNKEPKELKVENEDSSNVQEGHLPLMSILAQLIQPKIEKLLSYQTGWLRKYGFSHHQGCWIYALLTCLEKPLTPNAHALLRDLVRTCADLRSELKSKDDEFLKPLNLIICLVAHYFKQLDMSDLNFENAIKLEVD